MIYLLDTNTLIYMVRGFKIAVPKTESQKRRWESAKRIEARCRTRLARGDQVGLSAITVAELEYGARHSGDYQTEANAVSKILTPFSTYDFDALGCAKQYGEVRHALEITGMLIGSLDLLIAAHAKALGAVLITSDTADFSRIPGLQCQNWAV